jgi:hypothetical protein
MLRIICAFCIVLVSSGARVPQTKAAPAAKNAVNQTKQNVTMPEKKVAVAEKEPAKSVPLLSNKTASVKAPAKNPEANKMDLGKLEKIEVSLKSVVSKPHAPEGMQELLNEVQHAEAEVKTAKTEDAKMAVMKNISSQIQTFKKKLVLKKAQLEASEKSDPIADAMGLNVTVPKLPSNLESLENITQLIMKKANLSKEKAKSLAPIVQQLEARLDHLEYQEKNAEMTQAEFAAREKKVTSKAMQSQVGHKEATKAKMLMKYLKRKTQRQYKKKVTEWKAEKKALHDAINSIKIGKVDQLQAAMKRLNEVHAPSQQDFLH